MLDSIMEKLSQFWDDHGETVKTVFLTAVVYKTAEHISSTPQGHDDMNKFIGAFATGMAKRASEAFSHEDDDEEEADSEEVSVLKEENEDLKRQIAAYKRRADIERVEAENARREKKSKGSTTITQADVDEYLSQF